MHRLEKEFDTVRNIEPPEIALVWRTIEQILK